MSGHVGVDGIEIDAIDVGDIALNVRDLAAIHRGTRLAPGEEIVWRKSPSWAGIARDVFHIRGLAAYFGLLFALDAYQAWGKGLPVAKAVHDSVPLLFITVLTLAFVGAIAWFSSRTTRYTITDRRVILNYGIAMPATLSLPFAQIVTTSVSVNRDHTGDIALALRDSNHMPFLKLWPLARPWYVTKPQPMLRRVPQAALVGCLLVRRLQAAEQTRAAMKAGSTVREQLPELLSA